MNRIVTGLLVMLAVFILLGTACGSGRQVAHPHTDQGYAAHREPAIHGLTRSVTIPNQS